MPICVWFRALCLTVSLMLLGSTVQAQLDDYDQLVADAVREYDAGNYLEARALFARAHKRIPNARTSRALGFCSFELHQYVQAMEELDAALADTQSALTEEQRVQALAMLEKARAFTGKITLETTPVDIDVVIDGRRVQARTLRLDAGRHVITASASGYQSRDLTLTISGDSQQTVHILLVPFELSPSRAAQTQAVSSPSPQPSPMAPAQDRPVTQRWWFWTAIGVVAVGAAVATIVGVTHGDGKVDAGSSGIVLQSLETRPER
jgi:tetratricopeptide (TPR) repeat protein